MLRWFPVVGAARRLALLAALVVPAAAQALMLRDGLATEGHLVAYDSARSRLVAVGRHGETRELDGTQWLMRPGAGPTLFGALAYRSAGRRTLAFGMGYDLAAQTWEYDGVTWQRLAPAQQPSPRQRYACAYDLLRDRVVVFSGNMSPTTFGDTWEWDGANWQLRATTGPSPRQDSSMAFDVARGKCVLFGGQTLAGAQSDTWEWDGTVWTQRSFASGPAPRIGPALAYDPGRARVVMHGGFATGAQTGVSDEVWEYDGVSWQLVGSGGPGPRMQHDLVYDPDRGEVLAVGGQDAVTGNRDIHSWDGVRWRLVLADPYQLPWVYGTRCTGEPIGGDLLAYTGATLVFRAGGWTTLAPVSRPPFRVQGAMWSDGGSAWLFGGHDFISALIFGDTWSWSGTTWVRSSPSTSPPPRYRAAVAYDVLRSHAVLFGGTSGFGAVTFGDTWTFDGVNWQQQPTTGAPAARHGHGMAFDLLRGRTVLFGGSTAQNAFLRDTWEWNGSAWNAVTTAVQPPGHGFAALAYDARIQRTVMTTSRSTGSLVPSTIEAWTFDGATWAPLPLLEPRMVATEHSLAVMPGTGSVFVVDGSSAQELVHAAPRADILGTPCDPQAPRLCGRSWPEPGNAAFGLDVVAAPPQGAFLLAGSLQSASIPLGTCTLQLAAPMVTVVGVANAAGFASRPIPVPPQPALVGAQLWFQAAVAQPLLPAGLTLSPAVRVVVGD